MKRRKPLPGDSLKPGALVTFKDGTYTQSRGHVVAVTKDAIQVHLDEGPGANHEIVTARGRLVVLNEPAQPAEQGQE